MTHAILFASAFATVFLLVFQQQNVIHRARWLGSMTAIAIGLAQLTLWRAVPDASLSQLAAVLIGGPVGFNAALTAHPWIVRAWKRKEGKDGA
jgi:hypothetical protein